MRTMSNHTEIPKYRLKVTAGPDYDRATHQQVAVNDKTLHFESERAAVDVGVHIKDFAGDFPLHAYLNHNSSAEVLTTDRIP